jgi:hypothetical protein
MYLEYAMKCNIHFNIFCKRAILDLAGCNENYFPFSLKTECKSYILILFEFSEFYFEKQE